MAGWFPDPTGRFEYRYHNDQSWTADVSSDGQRYLDPLPQPGDGPPSAGGGNGVAIASMVCGIVAVTISWVPFLGIAGLITALVGLGLAVPALRRSRSTGRRRGAAITGLVTSAMGVALGIVGVALTLYLVRAIERYDDPGPYEVAIDDCGRVGAEVVATGSITNQSTSERDYTVHLRLGPTSRRWVEVRDVAADDTATFEAREVGAFADRACEVLEVRGPTPFGIDPSLFDG